MDSNVSKNTNSHKFFKVALDREKPIISVKNLIEQLLLSTLNSDRQKFNFTFDQESIAALLDRKIKLLNPSKQQLSSATKGYPNLFDSSSLGYACPLSLVLASYWQVSPQLVTDNLRTLFQVRNSSAAETAEPLWELHLEITSSGWLNFYLDSESIAIWLERSLLSIQSNSLIHSSTAVTLHSSNLFQVQYIHALCCSLLRLGARANLITLRSDRELTGWQIVHPQKISWLDPDRNLWTNEPAEYEMLRHLLLVTDAWSDPRERVNWSKVALKFTKAVAVFEADCRFLGEIEARTPLKAIARLGLIALAQYWLEQILIVKLKLSAPKTL